MSVYGLKISRGCGEFREKKMASSFSQTMDMERISRILSKLQSNSHKEVFAALKEIRKNVIKNSNGIRMLHIGGGLKSLVRFLDNPNEKTLDITLSILGNCCLDHQFRKEAGDLNISASVISILHNISTDSIAGRACRVLGNLAQDYCVARQLHENGAVRALLTTIPMDSTSTTSEATRQMAVRALGALWSVPERRGEMLRMNVVQMVAVLLTSETSPALLESVLKALAIFTWTHSQQCALQVNAVGTGFQQLVSCAGNKSLKYQALICITNLCNVASARPLLGNAGAVDVLVDEVKEWGDGGGTGALRALCLLSRESGNRTRIRQAGGLPLLLGGARNARRCLRSLEHYVYDEPSIVELLDAGLLSMLVELLAKCRDAPPARRKHRNDSCSEASPSRSWSPDCRCRMSPSTSPYGSPNTSPSTSPSTSPQRSPDTASASSADRTDSDDENCYSPVYSGGETDSEGPSKRQKRSRECWDAGPILVLLARVSHIEAPVVNMATPETLQALLDYLTLSERPQPRAARILARICRNPLYFIHIVLSGFVPRAHAQLLGGAQADLGASLLAQLSLLAESGFGEGEMAHHLLAARETHRETLAVAVPLLVKTPRLLKKLLLECNGLPVLMQVLERASAAESCECRALEFSAAALAALAAALGLVGTQPSDIPCPQFSGPNPEPEPGDRVLFVLDDGIMVSAEKSLLCHRSPYFEAMFRGGFCESHQDSIKLPLMTEQCWQNIVLVLGSDDAELDMDMGEALDVLKAFDRFLIPSEPRIIGIVLRLLSADSAARVYELTLTSGDAPIFAFLKEHTLKYILGTEMDIQPRMRMFSELLEKFGKDFLTNLECFLKTQIDKTYNQMYKMMCK